MKRMNKKGFTLIELLAVIIIMGVLLLIAVPSVSKYIEQSRMKTYASNLVKYADALSLEVNSYTNEDFTVNAEGHLVVPIVCLDLESGSADKSPFAPYVKESSYLVVTRKADGNGFDYWVAAKDTAGFGTTKLEKVREGISIGTANVVAIENGKVTLPLGPNDAEGKPTDVELTVTIPESCSTKFSAN